MLEISKAIHQVEADHQAEAQVDIQVEVAIHQEAQHLEI